MSLFRLQDALSMANYPKKSWDLSKMDFFSKIQFLIADDASVALQRYVDLQLLDKKRVSVIRGRIMSRKGGPLNGVRISNADYRQIGFTLSRRDVQSIEGNEAETEENDGKFDLVLNGGGLVRVHFIRSPYKPVVKKFYLPWNEILYVGDVFMDEEEEIKERQNGKFYKKIYLNGTNFAFFKFKVSFFVRM